ncbi:hypothetical protein EVAR_51113_1 [Eumeta japonica]|uniref:Uncharacterized protein n=1 Tax=Eumeta variegata TaxID=151549 RepID=A0A4C1Y8D4_EUMVA|nr:hypothetical protein EVAR_51113_1 [Eumeta japonica]
MCGGKGCGAKKGYCDRYLIVYKHEMASYDLMQEYYLGNTVLAIMRITRISRGFLPPRASKAALLNYSDGTPPRADLTSATAPLPFAPYYSALVRTKEEPGQVTTERLRRTTTPLRCRPVAPERT